MIPPALIEKAVTAALDAVAAELGDVGYRQGYDDGWSDLDAITGGGHPFRPITPTPYRAQEHDMSTFINPAKIRELAATGDQFYRGAAWVLDQQDAQAEAEQEARENSWVRLRAYIRDAARADGIEPDKIPADRSIVRVEDWDDDWSPLPAA